MSPARRTALFAEAHARAQAHVERWGEHPAVLSVIAQLEYLSDLTSDPLGDRSHLSAINIGVLAAREIEIRDPALAELLYAISHEAQLMGDEG